MKKQFYLLLACLFMMGGTPVKADNITIDSSNFPDEQFCNWLLQQSYGSDGILTEEEIAEITSMDVSEASISSLKGIAYFTALNNLNCSVNSISGEDMDALVADLPVQTEATLYVYYYLNDNEANEMTVAQVDAAKAKGWTAYWTSIRLSNIWGIFGGVDMCLDEAHFPDPYFRAYLANQLNLTENATIPLRKFITTSGIDIEGDYWFDDNPPSECVRSLEGLCYFPRLTRIFIMCQYLPELDLSIYPELRYVDCSWNGIKKLNLKNLSKLERLNFTLNHEIEEIDFSDCVNLKDLQMGGDYYKRLDLSMLTKLENTDFRYDGPYLKEILFPENSTIRTLSLSRPASLGDRYTLLPMPSLDVSPLHALRKMDCSRLQLQELIIDGNCPLVKIDCSYNNIDEEHMAKLISQLPLTGGFLCLGSGEEEHNFMNEELAAKAKERNWTVLIDDKPFGAEESSYMLRYNMVCTVAGKTWKDRRRHQ